MGSVDNDYVVRLLTFFLGIATITSLAISGSLLPLVAFFTFVYSSSSLFVPFVETHPFFKIPCLSQWLVILLLTFLLMHLLVLL